MYGGRNDLYAAASHLNNDDLKAICETLADDLAGETTYLEQLIVSHGCEPGFEDAITSAFSDQLMKLFRERGGDESIVSMAKQAQSELRGVMDDAIDSTHDPEVQSMLDQQRRHIEFAERVLRQAARATRRRS